MKKYIITVLALVACTGIYAGNKPTLATPTLMCAAGSTQTSINITFTAGANGAPAGFSIQWMTLADYQALGNQWPNSSDVPNFEAPSFCKASFSGNANGYNYSLLANGTKTVTLGDTLFDTPGASSPCDGVALTCGTTYVFRAFSHANSTYNKSAFSDTTQCSTLACGNSGGCTLTQGYWKTHTPLVCDLKPTSPLCIQWPVGELTLGTNPYSVVDLVDILNKAPNGNGLVILAHQLIAAKLNIANGADGSAVASAIASADAMIGNLNVPFELLSASQVSSLVATLTKYNEGLTGPGHCE